MTTIKVSENIVLRQILISDAPEIYEIIDSQREYLGEWLPFVADTNSMADSISFITSIYLGLPEKQELVFVILYENVLCGLVGFKNTDKTSKETEIGYWLSEYFQKKGIMTQSVQALTDYAFNSLNLDTVRIKCATGNSPSQKIPQRLNFEFERSEPNGEMLTANKWTDINVYIKRR